MSVWFCIPSKRLPSESWPVLELWRAKGYNIATWIDGPGPIFQRGNGELTIQHPVYPGYAAAVNRLALFVLEQDPECEWVVTGGDDVEPDPNHSAEEIAQQCSKHFRDAAWPQCWHWPAGKTLEEAKEDGTAFQKPQGLWSADLALAYSTFGVMQPTGDRWGEDPDNPNPAWRTPYIERVAGSPWLGREFCLRVNQGKGPLWPEYYHMGCDEELQAVATKLGVFWQRPDLQHLHKHWGRPREGEKLAPSKRMPNFLKRANSSEEWKKYKKLFAERQAAGFPGNEPL